jgi:hypothetical protein
MHNPYLDMLCICDDSDVCFPVCHSIDFKFNMGFLWQFATVTPNPSNATLINPPAND